jgi:putative oxidoreductase
MRRLDAASYVTRDGGLLLLRLVIGTSMALFHGYAKIAGGPERWTRLGGAMQELGISFLPAFWGFMAAFSEFFGSILLALGLFFRPTAALLAITMLVAVVRHLNIPAGEPGSGWSGASHALELLGVYVALFLTGPGRYSLGLLGHRDPTGESRNGVY